MIVQERLGRRKLEARAGVELAREKGIAARLAAPRFAVETPIAFAREAAGKFAHCVVLGGSRAPDVLARVFGKRDGGLDLRFLDSAAPDAVRAAVRGFDLPRTLFLAGAAQDDAGRYYRSQIDDPAHFVQVTDSLLLPAALLGLDLPQLVEEAGKVSLDDAIRLGAIAAGLARAGSGKLTFLVSPSLRPFGAWLEQLIASKRLREVVPVEGEPAGRKDAYGTDRLFISLSLESEAHDMTGLAESGHPVLQWRLAAPSGLLGEFVRWQIAAEAMAALLEIEPPEGADREERTHALLENPGPPPEPSLRAQGLALFASPELAHVLRRASGTLGPQAAASPAGWIAALLALADPGDYLALLPWFATTDDLQKELNAVQGGIRNATKLACTSGFGTSHPNGIFLQLTTGGGDDLPIPDRPYGFRALFAAQARAEFELLLARGLRVLRIHVEDGDPRKIIETLYAAVKLLSRA